MMLANKLVDELIMLIISIMKGTHIWSFAPGEMLHVQRRYS